MAYFVFTPQLAKPCFLLAEIKIFAYIAYILAYIIDYFDIINCVDIIDYVGSILIHFNVQYIIY